MLSTVVILAISAILMTIINLFCISIILSSKRLYNSSHLAILSLLLAHTIQGFIVLPSYSIENSENRVLRNEVLCDIFRFSYLYTNYVSCLSVLVISIDRFIGVQFPFRYLVNVTAERLSRVLMFIWVYVAILCFIPFIPSERKEKCHYNPQKEWVIGMLICHTFLPFLVIILSYIYILKKIRIHLTIINSSHQTVAMNIRTQFNKSTVTILIVAAYILCWGPSLVYYIFLTICPFKCFPNGFSDSNEKEVIGLVIKLLTLFDGFLTPLIYCFADQTFRCEKNKFCLKFQENFCVVRLTKERKEDNIVHSNTKLNDGMNEKCLLRQLKYSKKNILLPTNQEKEDRLNNRIKETIV